MRCAHCGAEVRDGARFCPNCGARIVAPDESGTQAAAPFQSPTQPVDGQAAEPETPQADNGQQQTYGQQPGYQQNQPFGQQPAPAPIVSSMPQGPSYPVDSGPYGKAFPLWKFIMAIVAIGIVVALGTWAFNSLGGKAVVSGGSVIVQGDCLGVADSLEDESQGWTEAIRLNGVISRYASEGGQHVL
jgi:hypothetical protein